MNTATNPWDDMEDDLFNDPRPNLEMPKPIAEDSPLFVVNCSRCGGTGRWMNSSLRACFACNGTGKMTRKTDPAKLAARRERKAATHGEKVAAWKEANPVIWAWLEKKAPTFEFAASLKMAVERFASLTERQMETCQRLATQDQERAAARNAERRVLAQQAPATDATALEECFQRALDRGLKAPKLRLGNFTFKPAKAHSKNPGAIYVLRRDDGEYLGKAMNGKLQLLRQHQDRNDEVLEVIKDPEAAAVAYGKQWGRCAICNRDLSDPESVARGIGPVCADKFF